MFQSTTLLDVETYMFLYVRLDSSLVSPPGYVLEVDVPK